MKSSQSFLLSFFALAAAATAAVPAAAQVASNAAAGTTAATSAVAAPTVLVDGKPIGAAEPWSARPIGNYDLTIVTPREMLIGHPSLADSAGKLESSVTIDGEGRMWFEPTVNGNELTLLMKRERAPITIHLFRRCDRVSGTWTVGNDTGTLEGALAAAPVAAPVTAPTGRAEAWNAKPVGKYRVTLAIPGHDMTADVTIREATGKLIANIWPVGDRDGRDFDAAVKGNQLVITGSTERGPVNLTWEHRGSQITGTWQLGDQSGPLSGEFAK